jgi:hypothetical protein
VLLLAACASRKQASSLPQGTVTPFQDGLQLITVTEARSADLSSATYTNGYVVDKDQVRCQLTLGSRGCGCTRCWENNVAILPLGPGRFDVVSHGDMMSDECIRYELGPKGCRVVMKRTCDIKKTCRLTVKTGARTASASGSFLMGKMKTAAGQASQASSVMTGSTMAITDESGAFRLGPLDAGRHEVTLVYRDVTAETVSVELGAGEELTLEVIATGCTCCE